MNKNIVLGSVITVAVLLVALLIWGNTGLPEEAQEETSQLETVDTPKTDAISATIAPMASQSSVVQTSVTPTQESKLPTQEIKAGKKYTAVMTTDLGKMTIELNTKNTPITANNFIFLAKKGFYDNVIFHRTIQNFMIQGGDPTGTGSGGPGYKFNDEKFTGEYARGTVAMANSGPNTNGSQFFIMHAAVGLPKDYVIFGKVISGLETVDKIATAPTVQDGQENSKPVTPAKILKVEVIEE